MAESPGPPPRAQPDGSALAPTPEATPPGGERSAFAPATAPTPESPAHSSPFHRERPAPPPPALPRPVVAAPRSAPSATPARGPVVRIGQIDIVIQAPAAPSQPVATPAPAGRAAWFLRTL